MPEAESPPASVPRRFDAPCTLSSRKHRRVDARGPSSSGLALRLDPLYGRPTSLGSFIRCGSWIAALATALALFPAAASAALTVRIADEASTWGRVTSDPVGIDCPADCEEPFAPGTPVTLRATATSGYSLAGWDVFPDDPGCEDETCEVTIAPTGDTSVDVAFHPAAELSVVPRGAGTVMITPGERERTALCDVDFQQELTGPCSHRYVTGTRVTLTAREDVGGTFIGWTDYACANSSHICRIRVTGERFIAARFTPVTLRIESGAFGSVTVNPPQGGLCALLETSPLCEFEYRAGKLVTLRREHGAAGQYWVGACHGHTGGLLDADVCKLRLYGDELVAAGRDSVTSIPPAKRSGLTVTLGGNKRGKVRGSVINGMQTLSCPPRCRISHASDYDRVRLVATARGGSRFVRWSGGSRLSRRIVSLDDANRIRATFVSRRR